MEVAVARLVAEATGQTWAFYIGPALATVLLAIPGLAATWFAYRSKVTTDKTSRAVRGTRIVQKRLEKKVVEQGVVQSEQAIVQNQTHAAVNSNYQEMVTALKESQKELRESHADTKKLSEEILTSHADLKKLSEEVIKLGTLLSERNKVGQVPPVMILPSQLLANPGQAGPPPVKVELVHTESNPVPVHPVDDVSPKVQGTGKEPEERK